VIIRKPGAWPLGPGFCDPRFASLWNGAIVYPLWEGAGDVITAYPNLQQNTGSGTFPAWTPYGLNFTAASSEYVDLPASLIISRDGTQGETASPRLPHAVGGVFRTTTSVAVTIYGEGDADLQPDALILQVRGDISGTIRYWFRTGDQSGDQIGLRSTNLGIDFADGEWHAAVGTIALPYGGSGSTPPAGTFAFVDGMEMTTSECNNLPYNGTGSKTDGAAIGIHPSTTLSEPMDEDISFVVTWKRALTRAEARLFSLDPFGMLRPVLRIEGRPWTPPIFTFEEAAGQVGLPYTVGSKDTGWEDELANTSDAELVNSVDEGVPFTASDYVHHP
jgi:hypothetical protein